MEDRKIIKFWLALGLCLGIFFVAFGVRVFAYETDDLPFNYIYLNPNDGKIYHSTSGYEINGAATPRWGLECGFPVPTYAGYGDYSLYFYMKFTTDHPSSTFSLGIAPYSQTAVYPNTAPTYRINTDLFGELYTYGANMKAYYGTFQWDGKTNCNYQVLCCREEDSAVAGQVVYSVFGVLNMRLMMEDEFEPFRLYIAMDPANFSSTMYNVDAQLKFMDTSNVTVMIDWFEDTYALLEDIKNVIPGSVDLSLIEDVLDSINFRTQSLISNTNALYRQFAQYEDALLVDAETDPDLTEFAMKATEFESNNDALHDIEESLIGTLSDYEFPTVANQTAVSNVVGNFFANEFVIALTLSMMALMIVFLIL